MFFSESFSDMTGEELGICVNSYKLYWECAVHQFTEFSFNLTTKNPVITLKSSAFSMLNC